MYRPKHVEWTCREINLTAHCCICWSFHRIELVNSFSRFNMTYMFDRFSKNSQISNFMKIRPVVVSLFHADGRTGMSRPIVDFRNFANALKKFKTQSTAVILRGLRVCLINSTKLNLIHHYSIEVNRKCWRNYWRTLKWTPTQLIGLSACYHILRARLLLEARLRRSFTVPSCLQASR